MTSNDKTPKRPVGGSRSGARAPRRIAGQPARPEQSPAESLTAEPVEVRSTEPSRPGVLERSNTTKVLGIVLAALAVVLAALTVTAVWGEPTQEDAKVWAPVMRAGEFTTPPAGTHPVTVGPLEWRASVDATAKNVMKLLSFTWETIDSHADRVQPLVTERFMADEYAEVVADTAERVKQNKAEYDVTVVGQSVITATKDRVQALIYVNQYVAQGTGKKAKADLYPLRLVVTAERDGDDWRIDQLDAG